MNPFGLLSISTGNAVTHFREKPRMNSWINGGFFVFNRGFLDYVSQDSVLEEQPLQHLARDGQLMAYRHTGFWACMDTYKDLLNLNELWRQGRAGWRTWN
jgi:glucose-1-phosphate cytidylyltransferase